MVLCLVSVVMGQHMKIIAGIETRPNMQEQKQEHSTFVSRVGEYSGLALLTVASFCAPIPQQQ